MIGFYRGCHAAITAALRFVSRRGWRALGDLSIFSTISYSVCIFLRENAETESEKNVWAGPTFPSQNADAERRELAEKLKRQHVFIEKFRKCLFFRVLGSDLAAKEDHIITLL